MSQVQSTDAINEKFTQDQLDALVSLHARFLQGRIGGRRAILKNVDLSDLEIKHQDLRRVDFTNVKMRRMDLTGTSFQEASLFACDLSFSTLNKVSFVRADLRGSKIEGADLERTDLKEADLREGGIFGQSPQGEATAVNFRGANLTGARLAGCLANKADFSDAILAQAKIEQADFRNAVLEGADLTGADIHGIQLSGAKLNHAILTDVDLSEIRDKEAGVDLTRALTSENIGKSVADLDEPLVKLIEKHRQSGDRLLHPPCGPEPVHRQCPLRAPGSAALLGFAPLSSHTPGRTRGHHLRSAVEPVRRFGLSDPLGPPRGKEKRLLSWRRLERSAVSAPATVVTGSSSRS